MPPIMAMPPPNAAVNRLPPGGIGIAAPQPQMGNQAAAMGKVRNALQMLQEALPGLPMGQPVHSDVLSAVKNLSKHIEPGPAGGAHEGPDIQALMQSLKAAAQSAPQAALMRANTGGGAPGAPMMPPPSTGA